MSIASLRNRLAKLEDQPIDEDAFLPPWRDLLEAPDLAFRPWMLLSHEERVELLANEAQRDGEER